MLVQALLGTPFIWNLLASLEGLSGKTEQNGLFQ